MQLAPVTTKRESIGLTLYTVSHGPDPIHWMDSIVQEPTRPEAFQATCSRLLLL